MGLSCLQWIFNLDDTDPNYYRHANGSRYGGYGALNVRDTGRCNNHPDYNTVYNTGLCPTTDARDKDKTVAVFAAGHSDSAAKRNLSATRQSSGELFYLSVRAVGLRRVTDNFFMPWPCQLFSRHGVRQGLLLWLFVASLSTKVGLFGHDYLPQESTLYSNRCQMLSWLC